MSLEQEVNEWIDGAAKPRHSLGLLEKYLKKMVLSWGEVKTELKPFHLVFAADNGVIAEGVAKDPEEITYLQAQNMVDGRATISCFCQQCGIPYRVIDVGINSTRPFTGISRKAAMGSRSFLKDEAMTETEFTVAWEAGQEQVRQLVAKGYNLISLGEMGIGNTTTSSAVLHGLTGILPEFIVGGGAGLQTSELIKNKCQVVAKGVELHKEKFHTAKDVLRCVGGFDMVAICAAMLECARLKTPFVIDGFITAVAYICASRLDTGVEKHAIPSHLSREPGMAYSLLLGNIPAEEVVLKANMALGEGTGAVLMVFLLKTMLYTLHNMARITDFIPAAPEKEQRAAL